MNETTAWFAEQTAKVRAEVGRAVVGQSDAVELMLTAIIARGHGLLEGVPGVGKTLLVKALGAALGLLSTRIQFTPDMMPSDITGTNVFHSHQGAFETVKGPVFTELLLADEINRTPPKTQAALLEAMQERSVTLDGTRHALSPFFTVFATQNPVEFEGTYPLPEAQRDRFLLWIEIGYPSEAQEDEILRRVHRGDDLMGAVVDGIRPCFDRAGLEAARVLAGSVRAEEPLLAYLRKIVRETRRHDAVLLGAGPRAGIALLLAAKARAALAGRDFITPDDVKELSLPVLRHRIVLKAESEIEGVVPAEVLRDVFARVEVPR
jgi:MoxR-like ATPase